MVNCCLPDSGLAIRLEASPHSEYLLPPCIGWLALGQREIYALTGYLFLCPANWYIGDRSTLIALITSFQEGRRGLWVGCPKQNQSESRQYINLIPVYKGPILVPSVPSIAHLLLQTLKSLSSEPQPLICQLRQPRGLDGFYLVCFNKLLRAHHQPPPVFTLYKPSLFESLFILTSFILFILSCFFPSFFPSVGEFKVE